MAGSVCEIWGVASPLLGGRELGGGRGGGAWPRGLRRGARGTLCCSDSEGGEPRGASTAFVYFRAQRRTTKVYARQRARDRADPIGSEGTRYAENYEIAGARPGDLLVGSGTRAWRR
jgi:hypothetical protein